MDFTELIDLASEKLGGAVLYANDEFFAPKENLLKLSAPIFIEGKYTDLGKWMDGWETRRRRSPRLDETYDWCIVRLGLSGIIHGVVVDTAFFRGNFPSHCSIEVCEVDGQPAVKELLDADWVEILPQAELEGDSPNRFPINFPNRVTHLKLKIYPDGGVARLRVFGEVLPNWEALQRRESEIDLAAVEHGGTVLMASDMFFGHRHNLIMPGLAQDMSDGWESKRRRGEGFDWCVIKLGTAGTIKRVEVDTSHFKGNYPESCSIEVGSSDNNDLEKIVWQELLSNTKLQAHTRHVFVDELKSCSAVTHVRFNIYPDGGVSRLRLFWPNRRMSESLEKLNNLESEIAQAKFLDCCGSHQWASLMEQARPFLDVDDLLKQAEQIWQNLSAEDWLEAFASHPKIGSRQAAPKQQIQSAEWSKGEQSDTQTATETVLDQLAEANRLYENKFGYIFIVCATGKRAEEMLEICEKRLSHETQVELPIAAEEQRKITEIRLKKLLESGV